MLFLQCNPALKNLEIVFYPSCGMDLLLSPGDFVQKISFQIIIRLKMMKLLLRLSCRCTSIAVCRSAQIGINLEINQNLILQNYFYGTKSMLAKPSEEVRGEIEVPTKLLEPETALSATFFKKVVGKRRKLYQI